MKKQYARATAHLVDCTLDNNKDWKKVPDEELSKELQKEGYFEKKMVYRANPEFLFRNIAEEYVLVPVGDAAMKFNGMAAMNETAAFLWKQLAGQGKTLADLAAFLAKEYELTEEQSISDVKEFLELALGCGLVLRC